MGQQLTGSSRLPYKVKYLNFSSDLANDLYAKQQLSVPCPLHNRCTTMGCKAHQQWYLAICAR